MVVIRVLQELAWLAALISAAAAVLTVHLTRRRDRQELRVLCYRSVSNRRLLIVEVRNIGRRSVSIAEMGISVRSVTIFSYKHDDFTISDWHEREPCPIVIDEGRRVVGQIDMGVLGQLLAKRGLSGVVPVVGLVIAESGERWRGGGGLFERSRSAQRYIEAFDIDAWLEAGPNTTS